MYNSRCLLSVMTLVLCLHGCSKNETVTEQSIADPFSLRADQYSVNHYFVDTSYIPLYEPFYQNSYGSIHMETRIAEAEVWVESGVDVPIMYNSENRLGVAWIDLPPRPITGYDSTYTATIENPGSIAVARFYQLDPSSYRFEVAGGIGVISFYFPFFPPFPDATFALAYRRADGAQYGDLLRNSSFDTTDTPMVLKMIKPRNLFSNGPKYRLAWKMLLKNIYMVHYGHISHHEFQLDVFRTTPGIGDETAIQGHLLLEVLGLDRFSSDGGWQPDGQFDFDPGFTVMQDVGEIIFPYLMPFDSGIREYFDQRGDPLQGAEFLFPELYDSTQVVAQQSIKNRYVIKGSAIFD